MTISNTNPLRIMARLDVKGEYVIKGVHLEGLKRIARPHHLAQEYYQQGIDEILFMDVVASLYGRNTILSAITEAAHNVFIPMTVGGGIRTLEDIRAVLSAGADKVAINTQAVRTPQFLQQAAQQFGSQCIVLSVEAKRRGKKQWEALTDNGRETTGLDVITWLQQAEALNVGEVLLTSVDCEGTELGFDNELIEEASKAVQLPIVACGGAGSAEHIKTITQQPINAVCCASLFHYQRTTIPDLKLQLSKSNIGVRL